jgi:hypothetical protein
MAPAGVPSQNLIACDHVVALGMLIGFMLKPTDYGKGLFGGGSYWDRTSGPCCVRAVLYR